MSNKRPAEEQLPRPVREASPELVAWCREEAMNVCEARVGWIRPEWIKSRATIQYVRTHGTPAAYAVLCQRILTDVCQWDGMAPMAVRSFLRSGALVPNLSHLAYLFVQSLMGSADGYENEEYDGSDQEEERREDRAARDEEMRHAIRSVLLVAAEFVVNEVNPGTAAAESPLQQFLDRAHTLVTEEGYRPKEELLWTVLSLLVDRFDFDVPDLNGDTPRTFLQQWRPKKTALLMEPPCGLK